MQLVLRYSAVFIGLYSLYILVFKKKMFEVAVFLICVLQITLFLYSDLI